MLEILLTHGQVALIDDEDYEIVSSYTWAAHWMPHANTYYATAHNGSKTVLMHSLILGTVPPTQVDHEDHNGCNNQRANIRVCSGSQNRANSRKLAPASSSYKGVTWDKTNQNWSVRIGKDYKRITVGRFDNEVDAARAYNKAALEMFGDFALLNDVTSEAACASS